MRLVVVSGLSGAGKSVALHALDIMVSILEAAATGKVVQLSTTTERPAPLTAADAERLIAGR